MIQLTRNDEKEIIFLPLRAVFDAETTKGQCAHGLDLMHQDCRDCELEAMKQECQQIIDKAFADCRKIGEPE